MIETEPGETTTRTLKLNGPVLLADVRALPSGLTPDGKRAFVGQAINLLENFYAHLPLKQSSLAVDPVQAARLLLDDLDKLSDGDFVAALLDIFQRVGDLHTLAMLPAPWSGLQAFLPYLIQEHVDEPGTPRYVVTNVSPQVDLGPDFVPGVEVTHWNGTQMGRMVAGLARQTSGANPAARHRAALQMLTTRSLGFQLPPQEDWVTLTYRSARGTRRLSVPWLVVSRGGPPSEPAAAATGASGQAQLVGLDSRGFDVQRIRKQLFAPDRFAHELDVAATLAGAGDVPASDLGAADDSVATSHPSVLSYRTIEGKAGKLGLLRIWNFEVREVAPFVDEVARLVRVAPASGLIIDVRGNPGGWIPAGEGLLQLFTSRHITPEPVQFRNTPLTRATARLAPELEPWRASLDLAYMTGERYSQGFPLTDEADANRVGQVYFGPVVLIVDAACYSACDFFAAGFQDHEIGPIVGLDASTGGGGANVWEHGYLGAAWSVRDDSPFVRLPEGADLRVAMRRSLRVGARAGLPVEGLGASADYVRSLTRRDLLEGNADLLAYAESLIVG